MKLWQRLRIDPFLVWDKLTNRTEFPDDVKEAIENNKPLGNDMPKHKVYIKRTNETDFVPRKNPNRECNF
jgi:hypothetical protein